VEIAFYGGPVSWVPVLVQIGSWSASRSVHSVSIMTSTGIGGPYHRRALE